MNAQAQPQMVGFFGRRFKFTDIGLTGTTFGHLHGIFCLLALTDGQGKTRSLIGVEYQKDKSIEGIGYHVFWFRIGYFRQHGGPWLKYKGI